MPPCCLAACAARNRPPVRASGERWPRRSAQSACARRPRRPPHGSAGEAAGHMHAATPLTSSPPTTTGARDAPWDARTALQVPGRLNTGLEFKGLRMREHVEHLLRTGLAENAQRAGRTPGCIPPVSNFEGPVGFGNVWEAKHGTQSSESTTGVTKGLRHACACGAPPTQRACRKTRNGAVVRPVASPQSQTLRAPSGLAKRCY